MIQAALSFVLGFLSAAFLALLVAPAIWRRAVALTRRRVEASLPLTMDQIQAEKDGVRAEYAMAVRTLEMKVKSTREKAADRAIEIGRLHEELAQAQSRSEAGSATIAGLESRLGELQATLQARDEEALRLGEEIVGREKLAGQHADEIEKLGRMYDDASFAASSRQIEIVAQEAKLEKLVSDAATLRAERKEADVRAREASAETRTLGDALRMEQRKTTALETKNAGLIASQSEFEEKLERRGRELERLREKLKGEAAKTAPARSAADRSQLAERLDVLTRENRKLRGQLGSQSREGSGKADTQGEALLRSQIGDLAAEVVHLTAMLDGDDASLRKALDGAVDGKGSPTSLAERIRALQQAGSTR